MQSDAPARATRTHHPSRTSRVPRPRRTMTEARVAIPTDKADVELEVGDRSIRLTNLDKIFWPEPRLTKRDLLQYYADMSPFLLPHLTDRAMVMKRYPNGATGDFF